MSASLVVPEQPPGEQVGGNEAEPEDEQDKEQEVEEEEEEGEVDEEGEEQEDEEGEEDAAGSSNDEDGEVLDEKVPSPVKPKPQNNNKPKGKKGGILAKRTSLAAKGALGTTVQKKKTQTKATITATRGRSRRGRGRGGASSSAR